ncbi:hypothetical protein EYF80_017412 [Liparis tanakae]|uniref:Uncharacterized protein n=1 Tax=Liparis tanakae TaxID=230148 RepID=A0A4Z2I571_9TELE|nr:hypothetical protein EYF80_017412 [Liparis tanakae]
MNEITDVSLRDGREEVERRGAPGSKSNGNRFTNTRELKGGETLRLNEQPANKMSVHGSTAACGVRVKDGRGTREANLKKPDAASTERALAKGRCHGRQMRYLFCNLGKVPL